MTGCSGSHQPRTCVQPGTQRSLTPGGLQLACWVPPSSLYAQSTSVGPGRSTTPPAREKSGMDVRSSREPAPPKMREHDIRSPAVADCPPTPGRQSSPGHS